jgi:hypothetical protein
VYADQQPNNDVGALLAGIFTDDRVLDLTLPLAVLPGPVPDPGRDDSGEAS